jgi:hypothetical protein
LNARTTDAGASIGPTPHEQVHVIGHHFVPHDLPPMRLGDLREQLIQAAGDPPTQYPSSILRAPHHSRFGKGELLVWVQQEPSQKLGLGITTHN